MILDCDDFISKAVSNNEIDSLLTYCYENEIKYVRLYKRHNKELRKYKTTLKHLYYCNKKARYCRSLMANIWHKEEYLKLIENDNIDGWEIEKQWLNEALTSKKGCFKDYCYYSNNPLHIVHAVAKGKWIRSAYRFARRNGIPKDMLSQRLRISIPATIKNTLSYMATGILPSWLCFKIKKLTSKIINYKSNY